MASRDKEEQLLKQAIALSRNSPAQDRYKVGALITDSSGRILATGYTGETAPAAHAEEVAIEKARAHNLDLTGATIYTSMEPCSARASRSQSCCNLIIENAIEQVVFALREPLVLAECDGVKTLEESGVATKELAHLSDAVCRINSHILET